MKTTIYKKNIDEIGCPMTIANIKKYELTEKAQIRFCSFGCSTACGKFFNEKYRVKGVPTNEKD